MFERKLRLSEERARRWVVAQLPEVEGYILHHGFWGGWHDASVTVAVLRREGHAVVGHLHFELVPEDQTHTLLRAHANTPTARQLLEQMMGNNEVASGKRREAASIMQECVHSPHQITLLVRWLKARVEHDQGEKWTEWLGDRARHPLWLPGRRGFWRYRSQANGEHSFSVSNVLGSPEAGDDEWCWIVHPDAVLGGSLMMSPAPDNSTDVALAGCTDQWRRYFGMLLEEMKRPNLAVAVGDKESAGGQGQPEPHTAKAPRVPKRGADLRRWRAIWVQVQKQVKKGKPVKSICEWLQRMYSKNQPEWVVSEDTLADIIRAGEASLLTIGRVLQS